MVEIPPKMTVNIFPPQPTGKVEVKPTVKIKKKIE